MTTPNPHNAAKLYDGYMISGQRVWFGQCSAACCTGYQNGALRGTDDSGPWTSRTYVKRAYAGRAVARHNAQHHTP